MNFILKGDIIYSKNQKELVEFSNSFLVCENNKSAGIYKVLPEKYKNFKLYDYTNKLIIPGFVDMHLHASQYQFIGINMDLELLDWLKQYTFKEEEKFVNIDYAKKAYDIFIDKLKKSATTRAIIFATIHKEATKYLFEKMETSNLISYIGKVNQDRNSTANLDEDTNVSIKTTLELIDYASRFERTKYIITPRFTPSCSDELLKELGNIVKEKQIPVQSHLCENVHEVKWVKELVKSVRSYADSYNIFGLLGNYTKTVMAHCIYLDDIDLELMKNENVFIAHCPMSNRNLSSGIAPIKKYLSYNINVGIGTDISAGSCLSMFRSIEDTITASKIRNVLLNDNYGFVSFSEAFYLATIGGGKFFGKVGSFDLDYEFDALVLDESTNPTTLFNELSLSERLERFIYNPELKLIKKFVAGKEVV